MRFVDEYEVDRKGIGGYRTDVYCEPCHAKLEEEKRQQAKREEMKDDARRRLYAEFKAKCGTEVDLAPIKELARYRVAGTGVRYSMTSDDLCIHKVRGRWHFCKNRAQLAVDLGLLDFYCFPDARRR